MYFSIRANNKQHVLKFYKSLAPVFMSCLFMAMFIVPGNHAVAQDAQVQYLSGWLQKAGNQGTTPGGQAQQGEVGQAQQGEVGQAQQGEVGQAQQGEVGQAQQGEVGQAQQGTQEPGDIQNAEITYFDPETIPESVPTPDAAFVFEVPVDVRSMHAQVELIGVVCQLFVHGDSLSQFFNNTGILKGWARQSVALENGAYNGTVTVGVNPSGTTKNVIELYECRMCLKLYGNSSWTEPFRDSIETRAHPDKPFNHTTGRKNIPSYARY